MEMSEGQEIRDEYDLMAPRYHELCEEDIARFNTEIKSKHGRSRSGRIKVIENVMILRDDFGWLKTIRRLEWLKRKRGAVEASSMALLVIGLATAIYGLLMNDSNTADSILWVSASLFLISVLLNVWGIEICNQIIKICNQFMAMTETT
jgi:hypothetical protein